MKQKILKACRRFAPLVLVAFFLGVTVYNLNAKFLLDDPMPMPLGVGTSVVISGSMEPTISVNDLIVVVKTDSFADRDVIVYESEGILVVHRIIAMDDDTVTTRGDANNTDDAPVSRDAIRGKVILVVPKVGKLVDLVKNPLVTLALLAAAVYLMERSFHSEKKDERGELEELTKQIQALKEELEK